LPIKKRISKSYITRASHFSEALVVFMAYWIIHGFSDQKLPKPPTYITSSGHVRHTIPGKRPHLVKIFFNNLHFLFVITKIIFIFESVNLI